MDPRTGQAAFRIAVLILGTSLAILPFQDRASREFVVTIMAALVGALFIGVVLLMARLSAPPLPPRRAGPRDNPVRTSLNGRNEMREEPTHDR